jgi:S1-C subfamily serine protease
MKSITRTILLLAACTFTGAILCPAVQGQMRMHHVEGPRGALGFSYSGIPDFSIRPLRWADYPVVRHVYQSSPARAAGLEVGDAILKVNGRDGCEPEAYHHHTPGERLALVVQRGREQKEISFVLVEPNWPDSTWVPELSQR